MSEDQKIDDVLDAELAQELVDEEQVIGEESLEEKAKKHEDAHEDEDEDEEEMEESAHDDEEEDEEELEESPKSKAAIMASVHSMMKKASKKEAMKIYASVKKGISMADGQHVTNDEPNVAGKKAKVSEADVSHIEYAEELDTLVSEEATLSDGFRDKAGIIFEAALKSKISEEIERLEAEYAQNLEDEVTEINKEIVEKVDSYLNYVVENWMKENEVAVVNGLRAEIAEGFMASLQTVFKEHYVEVPEGKVDLVDELSDQVNELEEHLNKATEDNIKLHEAVQTYQRSEVVRNASSGLAETEAEKLASLVEDVDFDDVETFEMKVKTIKESFFKSETSEVKDEANELFGEDNTSEEISDVMSRYSRILTKFNNS